MACLNCVVSAGKCQSLAAISASFLLVVSTGCERKPPPPERFVRIEVSRETDFNCPVRITRADGTRLTLEADQKSVETDVPQGLGWDNLEVFGPDGWIKSTEVRHRDLAKIHSVEVQCPDPVKILFDNRDSQSVELMIGSLKLQFPANDTGSFNSPALRLPRGVSFGWADNRSAPSPSIVRCRRT